MPAAAEVVVQPKLAAGGVEQPAQIDVADLRLKTGRHDRQVGVVDRRVQAGLRAAQRVDEIVAVVEVHGPDRQLGAAEDAGDLFGLFDIQVGDDDLVDPRVVDEMLHGNAAHLACSAKYGDAHRGKLRVEG